MPKIIQKTISTIRYLWSAFGKYRSEIVVMAILGFASGLFGGIGISIIIPLFALLSNQTNSGTDLITRATHKVFRIAHIPLSVSSLLLFIVILFILKALVTLTHFENGLVSTS